MNIPVIYEDDWLLVLNKPPGLLSIPTPKNEKRTLTGILNEDAKERTLPYRLHPCHRLDRETSGLIIYAKGKSTQRKMMELFKYRKVRKEYLAFVRGRPKPAQGQIKIPIAGQASLTRYKTIENRKYFAIVKAMPLTGRTNQLRIHFKNIGCPILGETKYAYRRDFKIRAKRLCLHAKSLEFRHPLTTKNIIIDSQVPRDLQDFLKAHPA
jgi:RluA family pseudouridine synthase